MKGVRIEYGDFAEGAKQAFIPVIQNITDFSKAEELNQDVVFPKVGNPCEGYSVFLDGTTKAIDENEHLGIWSNDISNGKGRFENPIVLELASSETYTSSGFSIQFDLQNEIFCTDLTISWYRNDDLIVEKEYSPNSAMYFFNQKVDNYNKVVVTMRAINRPYCRLRLHSVEFGLKITFGGDELKRVSLTQEMMLISERLPISNSNFVIDSKKNIDFSFQENQNVKVYFDDQLLMSCFVKGATRTSKTVWNVKAEDYISLLEDTYFEGGIFDSKDVNDLVGEIFEGAGVPYSIEGFDGETISGFLPYSKSRDALKQVTFAIGAVVDTAYSDVVKVRKLDDAIVKTFGLNELMQPMTFKEEPRVTDISVTLHEYYESDKLVTAYDATKNGYGNAIFVLFKEPLHNLTITNGTILKSNANLAIINIGEGGTLKGYAYDDVKTVNNYELVSVPVKNRNSINIDKATLVSTKNIDKLIELWYNYYKQNNTVNLKLVENKYSSQKPKYGSALYGRGQYSLGRDALYGNAVYGVDRYTPIQSNHQIYDSTKIGDAIGFDTEYLGNMRGVIFKQSFNLNGNIIVKNTNLRR